MLLGFKLRFVDPIHKGTKVHTMRVKRKIKPKIGETLYMYTGLRTANCMKITDKEKLVSTQKVRIKGMKVRDGLVWLTLWVDGRELREDEVKSLVQFDGFTDVND